ncbi:MAG: UPF0182 family protein [Anaerolineae bacterium]|nr:UPF0182 family protein [Anaerolineae bacterium]
MSRDKGCLVSAVLIVAIAILLFVGVDLYTDAAWFDSLGFASLLWTRLGAEWLLFIAAWAVASVVLVANWLLARRLAGGGQMAVPLLKQQRGPYRGTVVMQPDVRFVSARAVGALLAALAVGLGLFFALPARAMWLTALANFQAVPFDKADPILGRDISFYVFHLPWQTALQGWFLWLALFALAGAALIYLGITSAGQLAAQVQAPDLRRFRLRLAPAARRHLLALGAVALGLLAWGYQLGIPQLLYSTSGAAYGAGYADVHARLPVLHLLTWITVAGAAILLASIFVRVRWLPYAAVAAWLLVALIGGNVYPGLLQKFSVEPNELSREREYIEHTIAFTRAAFGLDGIATADYAVSEEAVPLDLEANESTIRNIRLWDYRPLGRTYSQLQAIRLYYTFNDVDIDRYRLGGDYRQVTLSAREINHDELSEAAQTWLNRHLIYTHGSGVVLSPVNEVGDEGLPELWVRDIPPQSIYPELALTQPQIYHGELTGDYVIANTNAQEFDYPLGDQNVYTTYQGMGGVRLSSPLTRLAYALRLGSSQVLLSGYITPDSRLLWRREISERVRTLAPFLAYDSDPYPVILNGRLVWLLDAYTSTGRYPYSEPIRSTAGVINYMRNPVKVTIDAYDGTVTFYLIDPADPLAATYARIFPALFRPVSDMDPALVAHWRYPEGLFRIQATKYQSFHMTDPQVFYNQEDLWSSAEEIVGGETVHIEPYYVNMRLQGQAENEFILMSPYTPSNKQNMIAWLYARNDGENYGQLGVYRFPKQQLVYGPAQVESRIDQDPQISAQLTLWNQRGSQVIRGNLLVIPVDRAILYVEPIFLQAESSQLPELRRVIVAYGNRIAMTETLAASLAQVMGAAAPPPVTEPTSAPVEGDMAALVQQANQHYQAAQICLQTGDWTCYGREMDSLEQVLQALAAATEQ